MVHVDDTLSLYWVDRYWPSLHPDLSTSSYCSSHQWSWETLLDNTAISHAELVASMSQHTVVQCGPPGFATEHL